MAEIKRGQRILSNENMSLALRMHAEGKPTPEIIKYFQTNKINCPRADGLNIAFQSKCYQAEIETYRAAYYEKIKEVPISHKRTRLEVRQHLLTIMEKMIKGMVTSDGELKKRKFKAFMAVAKRLDENLISAQDEMEKRPGTVLMLNQKFGGDRDLTMEELLVEERNILRRIDELKGEGISFPRRTSIDDNKDKAGADPAKSS